MAWLSLWISGASHQRFPSGQKHRCLMAQGVLASEGIDGTKGECFYNWGGWGIIATLKTKIEEV